MFLVDGGRRSASAALVETARLLVRPARRPLAADSLAFDFDNTVYAIDSTTVELCLSVFPWAHFRATKAAVKTHTLLDLRGNFPSFIHISGGKLHDVNVVDLLVPEPGGFYVMDRGYIDCCCAGLALSEKTAGGDREDAREDQAVEGSSGADDGCELMCRVRAGASWRQENRHKESMRHQVQAFDADFSLITSRRARIHLTPEESGAMTRQISIDLDSASLGFSPDMGRVSRRRFPFSLSRDPVLEVLGRRHLAERGVTTTPFVEHLDAIEQVGLRIVMRGVAGAVGPFVPRAT